MSFPVEPLNDRVQTAIASSPHFKGKQLRFESQQGRIVLRGKVKTYFEKQMAQEAIRRIEGVEEIHNDLEVTWGA